MSNQIDLSSTESATISYARWYSNNAGASPNADVFNVFVSDDNGLSYVPVETVGPTGNGTSGGWIETGFNVGEFVDLNSTIRVKFVASDLGDGSIVEAGIDDVRIFGVSCTASSCPADLTGDGSLNFFDVSAFLSAFSSNDPIADFTGDGSFNFFDVSAFLNAFGMGCP